MNPFVVYCRSETFRAQDVSGTRHTALGGGGGGYFPTFCCNRYFSIIKFTYKTVNDHGVAQPPTFWRPCKILSELRWGNEQWKLVIGFRHATLFSPLIKIFLNQESCPPPLFFLLVECFLMSPFTIFKKRCYVPGNSAFRGPRIKRVGIK